MRILPSLLVLVFAGPVLADEPKVHRGIPYAEPKNERQILDVYAAPNAKDQPIVLWIHGGGWRVGDRSSVLKKAEQIDELKKLGARITLDDQKRVISVNLGERRVTDADLVHLKGLQHLQELDLTRTKITGAGLVHIKDLTALRRLFLTDTKVDDSGITHLKKLKAISLIGLSGTKITDAALDHLRELTELKQVFCLGTGVTDAGAEKLLRALPKCQITH